jgi:hypothetical protein
MQVPRIVAGDNLDLPLLGTLFKKCGAFFIRRDAASKMDVSYKAALRGTVGNVLTAGHTLEVYTTIYSTWRVTCVPTDKLCSFVNKQQLISDTMLAVLHV